MNRELTLEIVKEFFKDKLLIERVYLFGSFERPRLLRRACITSIRYLFII